MNQPKKLYNTHWFEVELECRVQWPTLCIKLQTFLYHYNTYNDTHLFFSLLKHSTNQNLNEHVKLSNETIHHILI
jgi:hypothetical protein